MNEKNGSLWQFDNVLIEAGASMRSFSVFAARVVVVCRCNLKQLFMSSIRVVTSGSYCYNLHVLQ